MPIKFLLLGGVLGIFGRGGGGNANFIFMGAGTFLTKECVFASLAKKKKKKKLFRIASDPRGPKDQKNSRFRAGLKISSEIEIFERATHRGPIFCGEIETSRLKISSEIENFDRD